MRIANVLGAILALMLAGCATYMPKVDSIADGIAVTAASVETAAQGVGNLCLNTEPGGPCAPGAPIDTATKERLKTSLQEVLDGLSLANLALAEGNTLLAGTRLERTEALLAVLRAELARLAN